MEQPVDVAAGINDLGNCSGHGVSLIARLVRLDLVDHTQRHIVDIYTKPLWHRYAYWVFRIVWIALTCSVNTDDHVNQWHCDAIASTPEVWFQRFTI